MDDPLTSDERYDDHSVAVHVSQTQFAPAGRRSFGPVQSLMVLGCHHGRGTVTINAVRRSLRAGDLYVLPWGHTVDYRADPEFPFFVWGLHVIPWHDPDHHVELDVSESADHPLRDVAWRSAGPDPQTEVVVSSERERPALAALARYGIALFAAEPTIAEARLIGRLARRELARPPVLAEALIDDVPVRVRRLVTWIDDHLGAGPIAVARLAELDESSPATVTRMFRQHLGEAPGRWVARRRVALAQPYLVSTPMSIAQIAALAGYADPYYFSRQFTRIVGLAPSMWRVRGRG